MLLALPILLLLSLTDAADIVPCNYYIVSWSKIHAVFLPLAADNCNFSDMIFLGLI